MAVSKLDGAGIQKLKTIEEALATMQTLHGHVERMAIEVKNQRGTGVIPQQIKRIAAPLQGQLKGQFGVIADQVSTMILTLGRGGNDQHRVRAMREYVAQIRQALDVAAFKVEEQHTVTDEGPAA
ncbi:MAG TPA: hypothetical protein VL157_16315 [Gemmatimonadaceae bacterium]|jgi:hypothetical protein|nr:hypothetical protein [Gemmatimonadaceae bacterium]